MKTAFIALLAATTGWLPTAVAQTTDASSNAAPAPAPAPDTVAQDQGVSARTTPAPRPDEPSTARELRMNFRGVPLEMVLNYLAEATDFIINVVPGTDVRGKVDVWSNHPLTKDEAVELLHTVLYQNGFAAVRNGRVLTIMTREEAKKRDIPVYSGSDPAAIPRTDQMVTQVLPIRYANAVQMQKDLQPLLPNYATLTANESGNALVLTDTQANVRRMAEIVKALDTSISSISTVRVFPLRYADAKELANAVTQLFQAPTTQQSNDPRARFFARFGPGGRGGDGGGGDNQPTGRDSEAKTIASRVIAVADERTNSLVVSAPDEYIPTIEQLVREIDVSASDITELRVFRLHNADPVEMAAVLAELFPDEDTTTSQQASNFRFGRGGPFGGNNNNQTQPSERMKKMGKVVAVPDARTSSVIVSAASDLMPQIASMIAQLDEDPSRKQKVYIYSLENADPTQVEQVLRDMFEGNTTRTSRTSANRQQNSALTTRSQNTQRNTGNIGTGFGNTGGFGNQGTQPLR